MSIFIQECMTLDLNVNPTLGQPVAKISIMKIYRVHTMGQCWASVKKITMCG